MDKLFNWLGIQNEGMRRSLKVVFVIGLVITHIPNRTWDIFGSNNFEDSFLDFGLFVFLSFVYTISFIATGKCITWIKQGFDKNRTS